MGINMGVAHFIDEYFLLSMIPLKLETKDCGKNAYSSRSYCNNCKSTQGKFYFVECFIKNSLVA